MSIAIIDDEEYIVCDVCNCEGEHEVDAEYICTDCEYDLCFPHMKEWPQPKGNKPIHYCEQCYQVLWEMSA